MHRTQGPVIHHRTSTNTVIPRSTAHRFSFAAALPFCLARSCLVQPLLMTTAHFIPSAQTTLSSKSLSGAATSINILS